MTIPNFVGWMSHIKFELNTLLTTGKTAAKFLAQHDKYFMVCTLLAMSPNLASIQNQFLASSTIPNL